MKLRLDPNRPYAVALEGGGAKGAYQIGAWRALREAGIRFQAVSGTSVGALNGALMVMGDLEKATNIWENIRFSQIMDVKDEDMKNLLSMNLKDIDWKAQWEFLKKTLSNRGLDVTPLRQWMEELADEEAIRNSETELYIQTFSLTDRKELELRAKDLKKPGEIADMLLASAYFPAFRNEALGGKRYADGGLQDLVPIHVLVENGYRDIIAIRLYGVGLERSFRVPKYVDVHMVLPSRDLGGTLEFESGQSRKNLQVGYYDTMRMLYGLEGTQYYIDRQWSERQAYECMVRYLERYLSDCEIAVSLREMNEKLLPKLRKSLDCKGDYYAMFLTALEQTAEEAEIEPFCVYTEEELLGLLQDRYGPGMRRFPKFLTRALTFRSSFVKSKNLWKKGNP